MRWLSRLLARRPGPARPASRLPGGVTKFHRPCLEVLESRDVPGRVSYYHGDLLTNVHVGVLYYGNVWNTDPALQTMKSRFNSFISYIVNSPYMDMLGEYYQEFAAFDPPNVGRGVFSGSWTQLINPGSVVTDNGNRSGPGVGGIQYTLRQDINTGALPSLKNFQNFWIVMLPPGVASDVCRAQGFIGYHSSFLNPDNAPDSLTTHLINYAVIPYPGQGNATISSLSNTFDVLTTITSHELNEGVTDPNTIWGPAGVTQGSGWHGTAPHTEIGDLAEGYFARLNGYVVQGAYSNNQDRVIFPAGSTPLTTGRPGSANGGGGVDGDGEIVGPVAAGDTFNVPGGRSTTLTVLANDTDPFSNPLTPGVLAQPAHGSVAVNPDGSLVYTPANGYAGPDSFTYTVTDGSFTSDPATVSLTVAAPVPVDTAGPFVDGILFTGPGEGTFDKVTVTFNEPIDPTSFTAGDVSNFIGPNGNPVTVTGVVPADATNTVFVITFPTQTTPGVYGLTVGPDVRDPAGNPMNQNQNMFNGEFPADQLLGVYTLQPPPDTAGPFVTSAEFRDAQNDPGSLDTMTVTFSEDMASNTLTPDDVTLVGPDGNTIPVTGIVPVGPSQFDVTFAEATALGDYRVTIGTDVTDLAGNLLNQNQNAFNGEIPDDQFTATATIRDAQAPTPPGNLQVTGVTATTADLSWEASADNVGVAEYIVSVRPDGGAYLEVGRTAETTFTVTGLTTGTGYTVNVAAVDAAGNAAGSALGPVTPQAQDTEPPTPPAGLVAANATETTVDLSWGASTDNIGVTGYEVLLLAADGTSTTLGTTADTAFTATGLEPATEYVFAVVARDAAGNTSAQSDPVSVSTGGSGPFVTSAGFGTGPNYIFAVTVGFNEPIDPATFTPEDVVLIGPHGTVIPVTSVQPIEGTLQFDVFFDEQRTPGTYVVTIGPDVADLDGNPMDAAYTTDTTVDPPDDGEAPTPPGNLQVTGVTATTADLSWEASTDNVGVAEYVVSYSANDGVSIEAGRTGDTAFTITGLTTGTEYTVSVTAVDAAGNAAGAGYGPVTPQEQDTEPPTTPANSRVTGFTSTSADLVWGPASDNVGVTGYTVFMDQNGGGFVAVATTDSTSFTVTGLAPETSYTFYVVATDAAGNLSTQSDGWSFTTPQQDMQPPTPPAGVQVTDVTTTSVTLFWEASSDDVGVTGYDVLVRTGGGAFSQAGTTAGTSFTVTGLSEFTEYELAVVARDAAGNTAQSMTVTVTTHISGGGGPGTAAAVFAVGGSDGAVRVVDAATGAVVTEFRPLDAGDQFYKGLVQVALGDLNGDGVPDLFAAAANPAGAFGLDAGVAAQVLVYDGASLAFGLPSLIRSFAPFPSSDGPAGNSAPYVNGLNIAAGDVNGDGLVDLVAGTRGNTATAGAREYGRMVVVSGADGSVIGQVVKPFGNGYEKGVVVAAGDADGDGRAEVAVTRGGPVAPTNPNKTVKLKAFRFDGGGMGELNLSGLTDGNGSPVAFAPFGGLTNQFGEVIERDARVAFVDSDGDGRSELVFTALDPLMGAEVKQVRVGVYALNGDGTASLVSTGPGGAGPDTYLVPGVVRDHAIARSDVNRDGASDLALITESEASGIRYLNPITGDVLAGGFDLGLLTGGVTIDGL